jgi:hypothetical protein
MGNDLVILGDVFGARETSMSPLHCTDFCLSREVHVLRCGLEEPSTFGLNLTQLRPHELVIDSLYSVKSLKKDLSRLTRFHLLFFRWKLQSFDNLMPYTHVAVPLTK